MVKVILAKLFNLLLGTGQRAKHFLIFAGLLILFGLLMIIRIFWRPVGYLMIFIFILVLYKLISKCVSKKIEDKLEDIRNLINLGKFERALEKIEEVITKDLHEVKEDKRNSIYYKCTHYKASCIWNRAYTNGNTEYMKECIRLYEEALDIAFEENKPVVELMSRLGLAYYNLGLFQNDKEILKIAIKVLETALEEDEKKREQIIASIHATLGYCYQALANYSNREEYLEKSLEELDYAHDEISKGKYPYDEAVIRISRASALRKLGELNSNEEYKTKAIDNLNDSIKYLVSVHNKHYKKYFARQYATQKFYMAEACFEMFKIRNSEYYMKDFKEAVKDVKEYCAKENNAYFMKKIDEMLGELILEI